MLKAISTLVQTVSSVHKPNAMKGAATVNFNNIEFIFLILFCIKLKYFLRVAQPIRRTFLEPAGPYSKGI
jgi:hypothetical protein